MCALILLASVISSDLDFGYNIICEGKVVAITDRTVVLETSEDRVRVEFLKSAIGSVGTLDEQEAAAQRKPKAKKEAAAEETAEPATEEKSSDEE